MSDAAQDYWERRRDELSIRPKGADEIDTRFRRELEALAHQIAEFCHPYEDPLVSVAYAIARTLDLPNWPAASAELDERDDAAIAAASVVKSLRLATEAAPMSAQPSRIDPVTGIRTPTWDELHDAWRRVGAEAAGLSWDQFTTAARMENTVLARGGAPAAVSAPSVPAGKVVASIHKDTLAMIESGGMRAGDVGAKLYPASASRFNSNYVPLCRVAPQAPAGEGGAA